MYKYFYLVCIVLCIYHFISSQNNVCTVVTCDIEVHDNDDEDNIYDLLLLSLLLLCSSQTINFHYHIQFYYYFFLNSFSIHGLFSLDVMCWGLMEEPRLKCDQSFYQLSVSRWIMFLSFVFSLQIF